MNAEAREEETVVFRAVVNGEEQYSILSEDQPDVPGWQAAGKTGSKEECLAFIDQAWTDMRPVSLRRAMEALVTDAPGAQVGVGSTAALSLVDCLCAGHHPIDVVLRPERTLERFKEALDQNYVHLVFTDTLGGTELCFRLDRDACRFDAGDFVNGRGTVHVEGSLTLDYVDVRCLTDIDLATLTGRGRLVRLRDAVVTGA
jgi:uncharacterized protein YbdZ (MbtH family)